MILTYILPYFGSNSYALSIMSSLLTRGWGLLPQTWIHIWVIGILISIAMARGQVIGKSYLVAFPILAGCFDLLPVINTIPLAPTIFHILTLIMGSIGQAQPVAQNDEGTGNPQSLNNRSFFILISITTICFCGALFYWTSLIYRLNAAPQKAASAAVTPAKKIQIPEEKKDSSPQAEPPIVASTAPQITASSTPLKDGVAVANELVNSARKCLSAKKFECAISEGNAALRIDPANQGAKTVVQEAKAQQKKALDSISIK